MKKIIKKIDNFVQNTSPISFIVFITIAWMVWLPIKYLLNK